jgi:hypothetical protein
MTNLTWCFSFVPLLVIYLLTLAPSLTWAHHGADGGDLVVAVVRGSIPHPPGFPTYLLLAGLFVHLPWGDLAWRLNLMSAVLAAGAAGLAVTAVRLLLQRSVVSGRPAAVRSVVTLATGLALGLSPLFWSQALIVEVYAPAAFFAALVVVLALRGGPAWALGLAWGVGTGVHPTLLFLTPLVVWGIGGSGAKHPWRLVQVGLLALLGWGMMYGPVLLARGGVSSPWGDVSTPGGWWALVSGRLYQGYVLGLPLAAWPRRLLAWAGLMARQLTPLGAVVAGMGWLNLWRERRSLALASALAFGASSLYAVGYDTADSLVYLVPALPLAALWLGAGLAQAADWLCCRLRRGVWAILLLPVLQLMLFWGQIDLSGDQTAVEWAKQVLQEAPSEAVLLTAQDAHTFTLWYVHGVLGERPDVVVIDRDLWGQETYRNMMVEVLGLEIAEGNLSAEEAARQTERPVVLVVHPVLSEEKQ